eukprot:9689698-Karenia_brevis.AAC.1
MQWDRTHAIVLNPSTDDGHDVWHVVKRLTGTMQRSVGGAPATDLVARCSPRTAVRVHWQSSAGGVPSRRLNENVSVVRLEWPFMVIAFDNL